MRLANVAFFVIMVVVMYVGRKLGWTLSKSILYTTPKPTSIAICLIWGVAVAAAIRGLVDWQQPGVILRWIMGYALGAYVAIPNFGLLDEASIPSEARDRHLLVSSLPIAAYLASSVALAFLLPGITE